MNILVCDRCGSRSDVTVWEMYWGQDEGMSYSWDLCYSCIREAKLMIMDGFFAGNFQLFSAGRKDIHGNTIPLEEQAISLNSRLIVVDRNGIAQKTIVEAYAQGQEFGRGKKINLII